jgi:hypothetical protein
LINTEQVAERFARLSQDKQTVFLETLRRQGIDFGQLPIMPADTTARVILSRVQVRQWFLWQLDPSSTAYHLLDCMADLLGELEH